MNRVTFLAGCILAALIAGCSRPVFQTPEEITNDRVGSETFGHGKLRWGYCDVLGAKGPYNVNTPKEFQATVFQSSPGRAVTFWVFNGVGKISVQYTPRTSNDFFMTIGVVNSNGQPGLIVCQTTDVHNQAPEDSARKLADPQH